MKYIKHKFILADWIKAKLHSMKPNFGYNGFGEVCFYRTYSRLKADGKNETWNDVVIRVIQGVMSIRKNHYLNNNIHWDELKWQEFAWQLSVSMFEMRWLPPGRGLWAMGTDFIAERGSSALYNCGYTELRSVYLDDDIAWLMDMLMLGVGVGFQPMNDTFDVTSRVEKARRSAAQMWRKETYRIPDSREGWVESVRLAIQNWTWNTTKVWDFDYSLIRPYGEPIKGFGGKASGPDPLIRLHNEIDAQFTAYYTNRITNTELKTNIANLVGICVIAGNVRRSAEIGIAPITNEVFLDLKDYVKYPHRKMYGYMSNNTVTLEDSDDFLMLGKVAERVPVRGEPGIANLKNFKYGRVGRHDNYPEDNARGLNPCGEITLEHRELCNICETFPTRCVDEAQWYEACEHATFYCSTVSLLPTHDQSTNAVMLRNRRIGVGIVDYTNWMREKSLHRVVAYMNEGYETVRAMNKKLNGEAGVPQAIKVTTIKPGGTVPKLAGCVSGISYPTFNETLRRIRVAAIDPAAEVLKKANVPFVADPFDSKTLIFGMPILQKGTPADQVSIWEQVMNLITVQHHWADNAVSNTIFFRPKWRLVLSTQEQQKFLDKILLYTGDEKLCWEVMAKGNYNTEGIRIEVETDEYDNETLKIWIYDPDHEENEIPLVLAHAAPHVKSVSLLPHSAKGAYEHMPEEGLPFDEFEALKAAIDPLDWATFHGSDGINEKFCQGEVCEMPQK